MKKLLLLLLPLLLTGCVGSLSGEVAQRAFSNSLYPHWVMGIVPPSEDEGTTQTLLLIHYKLDADIPFCDGIVQMIALPLTDGYLNAPFVYQGEIGNLADMIKSVSPQQRQQVLNYAFTKKRRKLAGRLLKSKNFIRVNSSPKGIYSYYRTTSYQNDLTVLNYTFVPIEDDLAELADDFIYPASCNFIVLPAELPRLKSDIYTSRVLALPGLPAALLLDVVWVPTILMRAFSQMHK